MRDGGAYGCAVPRVYANVNLSLNSMHTSFNDSFNVHLRSLLCELNRE